MLLGTHLANGSSRQVFLHAQNPNWVVKIEDGVRSFQNVIEWELWISVKDTPLAKWFAPCVYISPGGQILVMERTSQPKAYPDKLPAFFTDLKLTNFGMYKPMMSRPQFVCHDYGITMPTLDRTLRKAKWWTLEPEGEKA